MSRKTKAHQTVAETLTYCWEHCDNAQEEEMLLWVAEKLAVALEDRYSFPDYRVNRVNTIDGPAKCFGNYPLNAPVAS